MILPTMALRGRGADRRRWATTSRWRSSPIATPTLFNYFKQLFAQVTNPPIDPIREDDRDEHRRRPRRRGQPARARRPSTPTSSCSTSRSCATTSCETLRHGHPRRLQAAHDRHHLAGRRGPRRARAGARAASARRPHDAVAQGRTSSSCPTAAVGPDRVADPVAAGGRGGPPPPRARGHAPADRAS